MRIDGVRGSSHSHHPEKVSKKLLHLVEKTTTVSSAILGRPTNERLYSKRNPDGTDRQIKNLFNKRVAGHKAR